MQTVTPDSFTHPWTVYPGGLYDSLSTATFLVPDNITVDVLEAVKGSLRKIRLAKKPVTIMGSSISKSTDKQHSAYGSMMKTASHPIKYTHSYIHRKAYEAKQDKANRIKRELLDAGSTIYGLMKSESRVLPKILHPNEHVEAVVYGQHHSNSVMLVATNERIIYLDKKPMALFLDEVSYEVVSGIEFEIHTLFATLILHTPVKNYDIRYANMRCAESFAKHIEAEKLAREHTEEPQRADEFVYPDSSAKSLEPKQALAGYYLLPTEFEEEEKAGIL